jgi:hypothetical protein
MKITVNQLRRIIKEEVKAARIVNEGLEIENVDDPALMALIEGFMPLFEEFVTSKLAEKFGGEGDDLQGMVSTVVGDMGAELEDALINAIQPVASKIYDDVVAELGYEG